MCLNTLLVILDSVIDVTTAFYKLSIENVPLDIAKRLLSYIKDYSESELLAETEKITQKIKSAKRRKELTIDMDFSWLSEDEFKKAIELMKNHRLSGNYTKIICIETERLDFSKYEEKRSDFLIKYKEVSHKKAKHKKRL